MRVEIFDEAGSDIAMTWLSRGIAGAVVILAGCATGEGAEESSFTTLPVPSTPSAGSTSEPGSGTTAEALTEAMTGEATDESTDATASEPTTGGDGMCGDGVVAGGEACDDGNTVDGDECTNACEVAVCGDGVVHDGVEGCDDGNAVDDDECSNTCAAGGCGDGVVAGSEACDDGNMVDTDMCTSACQIATCGDGFVLAGVETCDEVGDTAACNADCTPASCGDGKLNMAAGETCDDGNVDNADACVGACKAAACGDGFLQGGVEQCDDGNANNGDGCEANCTAMVMLPPECTSATLLDDATRSVNFGGSGGCDNGLAAGWYRMVGGSGTKMPTSPPPDYHCNSDAPGWLNGIEPSFGQGAMDRQMCFSFLGNPCSWSEPGKVTNCNGYFVYFLNPVSWGCSGRYCGTN